MTFDEGEAKREAEAGKKETRTAQLSVHVTERDDGECDEARDESDQVSLVQFWRVSRRSGRVSSG